jgi:glycerol uptake facilitator-like aquaporin
MSGPAGVGFGLEEESIVFVERERRFFENDLVMASLVVEFLGTALLVAAVSYIGTPIAVAGALLVALLLSSTAQLNPAITLWAYFSNKIGMTTAVQNMLAQAGGALAVWALRA